MSQAPIDYEGGATAYAHNRGVDPAVRRALLATIAVAPAGPILR